MKQIALIIAALAIAGCDSPYFEMKHDRFSLFETSKGTVYLLNTRSGEAKIIYSVGSSPKLSVRDMYEAEDGKTYQYLGAGKLKEMSVQEAADQILEKYSK